MNRKLINNLIDNIEEENYKNGKSYCAYKIAESKKYDFQKNCLANWLTITNC